MEVDLQRLKSEIEKELLELEQRRSVLSEQIAHIESVELLARGSSDPGKVDPDESEPEPESPPEGEAGKSWFRR